MGNNHTSEQSDDIDLDTIEFRAVNQGLGFHKKGQTIAQGENKERESIGPFRNLNNINNPIFLRSSSQEPPPLPSSMSVNNYKTAKPEVSRPVSMGFVSSTSAVSNNKNSASQGNKYLDLKGLQLPTQNQQKIEVPPVPEQSSLLVAKKLMPVASKSDITISWLIDLMFIVAINALVFCVLKLLLEPVAGLKLSLEDTFLYTSIFGVPVSLVALAVLFKSQTLGMWLVRTRVVHAEMSHDGESVTLIQGVLRLLGMIFCTLTFGLVGFLELPKKISSTKIVERD